MHTNRRDLLLAGGCAASTPLLWSVTTRLRAEEPDPPPETTTIRLAKSPSHLHRPAVRGKRPAECRGVHKRRLRRNRVRW